MNLPEILTDTNVPRDELWFVQPTGVHAEQQVTPVGDLRLTIVRDFKILGKIKNLA